MYAFAHDYMLSSVTYDCYYCCSVMQGSHLACINPGSYCKHTQRKLFSAPMMASAIHEIYDVVCGIRPELNGQYVRDKANYYKQKGGIHILTTAKARNNAWGIGDGKFFICLAITPTADPSEAKDWTSLRNNTTYVPCRVQVLPWTETLDKPLGSPKLASAPVPPVPPVPPLQRNAKEPERELESELTRLRLQATNAVSERQTLNEVIKRQTKDLENAHSRLQTIQASLNKSQAAEQELRAKVASLEAANNLLQSELEDLKQADQCPIKECPPPPTFTAAPNNAFAALVKRHVLRDAPADADAVFPSGAQIRTEFLAINSRIEAFGFDAMNSLEDLGHNHSTDFFTAQVMVPLYAVTQRHVAGLVEAQRAHLLALCGESAEWGEGSGAAALLPHRQFFLSTQQTRLLEQVMQLDESRIAAFVAELGPTAVTVREAMQAPTFHGILEDGLRLDQLVRFMLRMHLVAMLSDPRCHLLPLPGQRLPYQPHLHTEILSPGVKRHGYIKENEEVEVVFCGLCFRPADLEPPTDDPVAVSAPVNGLEKPPALVPALVRRVVADAR